MSDLQNRIIYRSSPEAVKFAWRVVLLSCGMAGLIFVLIPLTSKMDAVPEDPIMVRKIPKLIEIPKEEEEIFQEKPPEVKQETEEVVEVVTPPTPPPPAISVNIDMAIQPTAVSLHVDNNFKRDFDFDVEKIVAVAAKAPPSTTIIKSAPVKIVKSLTNYNTIFAEGQVDEKARRTKYVPPSYPMRARRRNLSGKVTIDCVIDKQGKVTQARVMSATPKGYFENSCLSILDRLKYEPAKKDGRAVKQRTILTFQFGLQK
ncbi:MAG: energy transducer TonB [Lentisphaerales bacterium]|nr:energy transducer TonB [Lentisphaerales bacterium]